MPKDATGAKAAAASGKSKKKWSKTKSKENKAVNAVLFDAATYQKLTQTIPSGKLITISSVSERLQVNGSCARRAIKMLAAQGLIKPISVNSSQMIYTRATKKEEETTPEKAQ
ncbi:putative component of cytosolic 80S ribosome and 40S small subunit [Paratrimastix pyriformis]|uniref:40S ribosomal protein S25 n=1 Tax=Paratrimastix pyriformis TaxID=342808 RepID=A0ABQ8UUD8_9EUKA|nr:putative component of cytosolic 80S ribosome and 40S small subunit [Paratrimastix pyriformis]